MVNDEMKERMRITNDKKRKIILAATNNGRCWWLYQQLIANPRQRRK